MSTSEGRFAITSNRLPDRAPRRLAVECAGPPRPLSGPVLEQLAATRLQATVAHEREHGAAFELTGGALRKAFLAMPAVREALALRSHESRTPHPSELSPLPPPDAGIAPPDIHVVDTAPFFAQTNRSVISGTPQLASGGTPDGLLSARISVPDGLAGAGQCWGAVGQAFVSPGRGQLVCTTELMALDWSCTWDSFLWRLAAGNVWIGQVVNLFDAATGKFLHTEVQYTTDLYSYSDRNLSDMGHRNGGFPMTLTTPPVYCPGVTRAECWAWVGTYGDANGRGADGDSSDRSHLMNEISARLSSLVVDFWNI